MTRIRFIKPWGPKKAGDIQETESPTTVRWLVEVYKVAIIEPDNPIATAEPAEPVTDVAVPKFIRKSPRDKMTRSSFNKSPRY